VLDEGLQVLLPYEVEYIQQCAVQEVVAVAIGQEYVDDVIEQVVAHLYTTPAILNKLCIKHPFHGWLCTQCSQYTSTLSIGGRMYVGQKHYNVWRACQANPNSPDFVRDGFLMLVHAFLEEIHF
jgi:hypothetical protein